MKKLISFEEMAPDCKHRKHKGIGSNMMAWCCNLSSGLCSVDFCERWVNLPEGEEIGQNKN